jgi:hypothetical protein
VAPRTLIAVFLAATAGCTLDSSLKHRCKTTSDCVSDRVCVRNVCQAPSLDAPRPNYVFVTSKKLPTRFRPLEIADTACNEAAADARLPGDYRAWLSTADVYARDRLGNARGWVRPDGVPFADTIDDIGNGRILAPPLLDEHGQMVANNEADPVATGTNRFGFLEPGSNCHDWANDQATDVAGGLTVATTELWTAGAAIPCGVPLRIYCFGVDQTYALPPAPVQGKRAFLTGEAFVPATGIQAADALCASDAAAGGLQGTFLALLGTNQSSAAARFSDSAGGWVRVDGVVLSQPASDLLSGSWPRSPLNVTSRGEYVGSTLVLAGAETVNGVSIPGTNCNNWTNSAGTSAAGVVPRVDWWFGHKPSACNVQMRVYCLER